MSKRTFQLPALLLLLAASGLAGCDMFSSTDVAARQASQWSVEPRRVTPEALRAAVKDPDVRRFYEARNWSAAWDGDRLTLWDKTQWVHNVADEIAAVVGIPAENIRVVSPFVGGAFGSGLRTWPHVTLAALGARLARRPVKVMLSRREMYYGVGYRPYTIQRVALGASREGRLAAIVHDGTQETSSYEEFSEALISATGFRAKGWSLRRESQSKAFVARGVGKPLYSGVTKSMASWSRSASRSRAAAGGTPWSASMSPS